MAEKRATKFGRERRLVELLMGRLTVSASYADPNSEAGEETGVDVIAITEAGRIGLQVTELDTGDVAGRSRGDEKKLAREAERDHNGVYSGWAQNDPSKVLAAIERAIERKSGMTHAAGFAEVWLLISVGLPEHGAVISSLAMTPGLSAEALSGATAAHLEQSRFDHVYFHPVLGVERALYHWSPQLRSWEKSVQPEPRGTEGPSFFDVIRTPDWLNDSEGMCDREIEKVLAEIREGKIG